MTNLILKLIIFLVNPKQKIKISKGNKQIHSFLANKNFKII